MSEEEKKDEQKCFCQSKGFRKFLVIALGSFVGVYTALCLFAALHRPPIMPPCPMGYGAPIPNAVCPYKHMNKHHFHNGFKGDKIHYDRTDKGPAPFDAKVNDVKD